MNSTSDRAASQILNTALHVWRKTEKQHLIPIIGRSMWPLIRAGDQILVEHGGSHLKLRRGDVILFCHPCADAGSKGCLIAHRVIRIASEDSIITKGDNLRHVDPPLSAKQILGRVLMVKRGKQQLWLNTPIWRLIGWLIAVTTPPQTQIYRWVKWPKQLITKESNDNDKHN